MNAQCKMRTKALYWQSYVPKIKISWHDLTVSAHAEVIVLSKVGSLKKGFTVKGVGGAGLGWKYGCNDKINDSTKTR
jgi:hypothetical protein